MLGIKKRIIYTWAFITSISMILFGIQLAKYYPGIIYFSDLISIPLALSFIITLWYVDNQYEIISTNKTLLIVESYLETGSMFETAKNLDLNANIVRRNIQMFLRKALD